MSVTEPSIERIVHPALHSVAEVEDAMTEQLAGVRRRLEALRTQVVQFRSRDLARRRRRIQTLELQHDAIRGDLLSLRKRQGIAWETLRVRIERALDELQKEIDAVQNEADKPRGAL